MLPFTLVPFKRADEVPQPAHQLLWIANEKIVISAVYGALFTDL